MQPQTLSPALAQRPMAAAGTWRIHLLRLGKNHSEAMELAGLLQEMSPSIRVEGLEGIAPRAPWGPVSGSGGGGGAAAAGGAPARRRLAAAAALDAGAGRVPWERLAAVVPSEGLSAEGRGEGGGAAADLVEVNAGGTVCFLFFQMRGASASEGGGTRAAPPPTGERHVLARGLSVLAGALARPPAAVEGVAVAKLGASRLLMQSELFASELMRHVGVATPAMRILRQAAGAAEWEEAMAALHAAAAAGDAGAARLAEGAQRLGCMLLMECVAGGPLSQQPAAFQGATLPRTLRQLGRLVMGDMLLGNADRLPCGELGWRGNPGNLLYGAQGSRFAGQVVAIDSCVARRPPASKASAGDEAVERLAQLALASGGVARALLAQLLGGGAGGGCLAALDERSAEAALAEFQAGLREALAALMSIKGLLEMVHQVAGGWVGDFMADILSLHPELTPAPAAAASPCPSPRQSASQRPLAGSAASSPRPAPAAARGGSPAPPDGGATTPPLSPGKPPLRASRSAAQLRRHGAAPAPSPAGAALPATPRAASVVGSPPPPLLPLPQQGQYGAAAAAAAVVDADELVPCGRLHSAPLLGGLPGVACPPGGRCSGTGRRTSDAGLPLAWLTPQASPRASAEGARASAAAASKVAATLASIAAGARRDEALADRVDRWKGVLRAKATELLAAIGEWQVRHANDAGVCAAAKRSGGAPQLTTGFLDGSHPLVDAHELAVRLDHLLRRLAALQGAAGGCMPVQIAERLWLGGAVAADSSHILRHLGVTHIVCAAAELAAAASEPRGFSVLCAALRDVDGEDAAGHFPEVSRFIDGALAGGGAVLVHCYEGKSRSVTLLLAHLMLHRHWTLAQALGHVRALRPEAAPNEGFMRQLHVLDGQLHGSYSLAALPALRRSKPAARTCSLCGAAVGVSAASVALHMRRRHGASEPPPRSPSPLQLAAA